jgi:hypothetical protein
VAAHVGRITGTGVREVRRIGGQHSFGHYRVLLADGRLATAKVAGTDLSPALSGVFEAAAPGCRAAAPGPLVSSPASRCC